MFFFDFELIKKMYFFCRFVFTTELVENMLRRKLAIFTGTLEKRKSVERWVDSLHRGHGRPERDCNDQYCTLSKHANNERGLSTHRRRYNI